MATSYKNAQVLGTASTGTYATLYTTPSATQAVISTIVICNTTSSSQTFRIGLDDTAGTPGTGEFLVYDAAISGNDTITLTLGMCMGASEYLRVSSSAATVAFSAFISEIT